MDKEHFVVFDGEEEDDDDVQCSEDSTPTDTVYSVLSTNEKSPEFGTTKKALVPPRRDGETGDEVRNRMEEIGGKVKQALLGKCDLNGIIERKMDVQLSSSFLEKKARMRSYIKDVVKDCNRNIKQHWKDHLDEIREFKIEYTEMIITLFQQWDSDIKQIGEQEEKLTRIFYQQQKSFQQSRILQSHSLKALTQADEEFLKDLEELEKNNGSVLTSLQNEFKKQKALLQRKITDS